MEILDRGFLEGRCDRHSLSRCTPISYSRPQSGDRTEILPYYSGVGGGTPLRHNFLSSVHLVSRVRVVCYSCVVWLRSYNYFSSYFRKVCRVLLLIHEWVMRPREVKRRPLSSLCSHRTCTATSVTVVLRTTTFARPVSPSGVFVPAASVTPSVLVTVSTARRLISVTVDCCPSEGPITRLFWLIFQRITEGLELEIGFYCPSFL